MSRIHYTRPSITALETSYAADAAAHGWGERCNEYVERFERGFADHLGAARAMATSSCTGAMHLGLAALGIGAGDEVIVPDITWIATAAPAAHLGARPVLVDVLADTWCIDPAAVERAITPRTRAIVAVHLYGNVADLAALLAIGEAHGIPVIEDAAEAVGARWRGRRVGSVGRFGTFSFHGTKTLTTGEGGMLVTSDAALAEAANTLNNHGRVAGRSAQFWSESIGYKFRMSNLQAAIGCAQLERVEMLVSGRRRVFEAYRAALDGCPLRMNPEPAGTVNGYWMPTIVVDDDVAFDRAALLEGMRADGIDARVFFWPLSMQPAFAADNAEAARRNPVAYAIHDRALNLPSYHDMTESDIERVAAHVRAALRRPTAQRVAA